MLYDEGIEAARNACVGGASIASAAMTAAAYCDNPFTGLPALRECLFRLESIPLSLESWRTKLAPPLPVVAHESDSPPGFGLVDPAQANFIGRACARLRNRCCCPSRSARSTFFLEHEAALRHDLGCLNSTGLAALVFADHGVLSEEAERLYLAWKLEPAIREAQRARVAGLARFPFMSEQFDYEGSLPEMPRFDLAELMRQVGLD